jgi:gluconolactonase
MSKRQIRLFLLTSLLQSLAPVVSAAQSVMDPPFGRPDAIVDLRTSEGVGLVRGQWRYSEAKVAEIVFRGPGPDRRPSGPPNRTYDIVPHAGAKDFDDSSWEAIDAPSLERRRSTGRICFNWYRITVTVPEKVGNLDPTGATVAFEIVVDDYAEVWVNGALPRVLGQAGGPLIKGFNAPNRVVLTRNARPGQQFQIAVFGANGPFSDPPMNFIWVRSATLDFYNNPRVAQQADAGGRVERLDPALDAIVPRDAKIEKLAGGFLFTEGPVWVPATPTTEGYLLFSDPNNNTIYRWTQDGQLSVYMTKSGYTGFDIGEYGQPGSNGLTLDKERRLTINQHGNRRVVRQERDGSISVLADRFEGKRFNSPNDLVYKSDGSLYFTDPFFGLPKFGDDPRRELPFTGVFRFKEGRVTLLTREFTGPNGIAFSPDEKYLYIGNWDDHAKIVKRFTANPDGTISNGTIFADLTSQQGEDAIDGLKVDQRGNVYISGPRGLWVYSPEGKPLGLIVGPEHPHNFAWGDDDGRTLYLCAKTGLYRIRLNIPGVRPLVN